MMYSLIAKMAFYRRAGISRDVTLHRGGRTQKIAIMPRITSGSMLGLYELAIASQGVALVPDFICGAALDDGRLVQLLKGWHTEVKPVSFTLLLVNRHCRS